MAKAIETVPQTPAPGAERPRRSLSASILFGMLGGIAIGVLFGERVAFLHWVGEAFIRLLQMTILPYIMVSLIVGIAGLSYAKIRALAIAVGALLLLAWVIALALILAVPLSFPTLETASFFSSALVEEPKPVDWLDLYIPANPFHALASSLLPAIMLFSISIGIALIGLRHKQGFLDTLRVLSQSLARIARFVVNLTPLGVFAIAASVAGTVSVEELGKLQVYLIAFTVASLILAFWVLPLLATMMTPFKYRTVVGAARDALVTAFTTGNLFVVIPMLTDHAKGLFGRCGLATEDTDTYVDVTIPMGFVLPHLGKLILLLFVLFAAWFSGTALSPGQYLQLGTAGAFGFFAGADVALPWLLDLMQVPADMYQLHLLTDEITSRVAALLGAMALLVFSLIAASLLTGRLKIGWKRLLVAAVVTLLLVAGALGAMRTFFATAAGSGYVKDEIIANMQLLRHRAQATVHAEPPEITPDPDTGRPLLERILDRGVLRVGYSAESLPFAFFNLTGELVGFDIDMAHLLATEIGVALELIPIDQGELIGQLEADVIDVAMSGLAATTPRLARMTFSKPYMDVRLALITRDHRRGELATIEQLRAAESLKIAVVGDHFFRPQLEHALPDAELIELDTVLDFFVNDGHGADALLDSAESGSAWTLLFPEFTVVVPRPGPVSQPLAYPVAEHDARFADFLSHWIEVTRELGDYQALYNHWILGLDSKPKRPRWSVIRNVLGWVDD